MTAEVTRPAGDAAADAQSGADSGAADDDGAPNNKTRPRPTPTPAAAVTPAGAAAPSAAQPALDLFRNPTVARALAASCLCSAATGWVIGVWGGVSAMEPFAEAFFAETASARRQTTGAGAAAAAAAAAGGSAQYCLFNDQLLSLGGSIIYPAALPALAVASHATHRFGRVPTMWAIAGLLAAGAAVGAAAPARRAGLAAVFASRSLLGAAMGCSFQAPAMLLAEVAPRALRGRALFTNNLALLLGFLLSALANQALAHREWGWRASAALVAAPGAVLAALLPWVRESPQVLLQRGDRAGARAALAAARPSGADIEDELRQMAAAAASRASSSTDAGAGADAEAGVLSKRGASPRPGRLAPPPLRASPGVVVASALYPLTLMLTGLSALSGWTPNLLLALGAAPRLAYAGNTAMMLSALAAAALGAPFVDRVGRRALLLWGSAGVVATLVALAALLAAYLPGGGGAPPPPAALLPVAVALLCLNRAALSSTLQPLAVTVPTEVQPLAVRSRASALTTAVRNASSFFVTQFALPVLCSARWGLFLVFAAATALGAAALLLLVPETRGLAIEEVHLAWDRHWFWGRRRHRHHRRGREGEGEEDGDVGERAAAAAAAAAQPPPVARRASLESCESIVSVA